MSRSRNVTVTTCAASRSKSRQASQGMTSLIVILYFVPRLVSGRHSSEYAWSAGDWRGCQSIDACGPSESQESRIVSCLDRRLDRPVDESQCSPSSRPPDRRHCFRVCGHHRGRYRWSLGPWSVCRPVKDTTATVRSSSSSSSSCHGVQFRNVTCESVCHQFTSSSSPEVLANSDPCENFEARPPTERRCRLSCHVDCITTEFGPWTQCLSCSVRDRIRHKAVLAAAVNGGRPCTELVEAQPCPSRAGGGSECRERARELFRYRLGRWSECLPHKDGEARRFHKVASIFGSRWRAVECIDPDGNIVDSNDLRCLRISKKPVATELCLLDAKVCGAHDVNSHWTNYNQSLHAYETSERNDASDLFMLFHPTHRQVLGLEAKNCSNTSPAKTEKRENRCQSFRWITGGWTECSAQMKCGQGVQNRTVLCVRTTDSSPVADNLCPAEPPQHTRRCLVPCPEDCIVTSWSEWSECLPETCRMERVKQKDGYRLRPRGIVQEGSNGGRECPHLHAVQPCEFPACYSWKTIASGQCTVRYKNMTCGEGVRNITVECVNTQGVKVLSGLCPEPRPKSIEPCVVQCPNDCLLSEWNHWSPCSQTCSLTRIGGYRTRHRDILARPRPGGANCSMDQMMAEERCGELQCVTYHWQTKDWSSCRVLSSLKCGDGVQYREVYCVENSGERVAHKRCPHEYSPVSSRNCSVPCPVDCVVSVFTDWSSCSISCLTDKTSVPDQYRYRFILEYPGHGGVPCPHLTESQPCTNLPRCVSYRWQLSEWSSCIFVHHNDRCGQGYRSRVVRCYDNSEDQMSDEKCLPESGIKPVAMQRCYVTCGQEPCVFSDWSLWSPCSGRCHGTRKRIRTMEGSSGRIPECFNAATYPTQEVQPCNHCQTYAIHLAGLWSDCILDPPDRSEGPSPDDPVGHMRASHAYSGIGKRYHSLVCTDPDQRNVSALTCNALDYMNEMCFIPCQRDCQMSGWSSWSSCTTAQRCGNGERQRSRYLIDTNLDGGRDCPPLVDGEEYQTLPCHLPCERFKWVTGDWSICTSLTGVASEQCDSAYQSRSVKCVQVLENEEVVEDEDKMCDQKTKPRDTNHCHVSCPNQCVVSSWSEWTKCPEHCQSHTRRQRSRAIIRPPDPSSGSVQCPVLEEFDRCDLEPRCDVYTVRWTDWGPCIPHQNLTCGSGTRRRFNECLRSDGSAVSKEFCHRHSTALRMAGEEPCTDPCPVDCIVSEWSLWSPCSTTCGLGLQERSRTVLVKPDHRGRHCPDPLTQRKYCPFQECFQWRLNDWGDCEIEDDSCGYGLQHRSLKCIRSDENEVDPEFCDPKLLSSFKLTAECLSPCPGDCHLSDWSSWGPCHRPCDEGNAETVGFQTRSRVILKPPDPGRERCSSHLIETKRCSTGHCPRYRWHTGSWIGNKRLVWCQDITGARVIGGCNETERPSSVKTCRPPCVVTHSECRSEGQCLCKRGFDPVYRSGRLINCESSVLGYDVESPDQQGSANLALYHPYDISTDAWMYSIMASGLIFIILLITAIYVVCWRSRVQRNAAEIGSDDERQEPNRNGKCLLGPNSEKVQKISMAEKSPANEYFSQTELGNAYGYAFQSGHVIDPNRHKLFLSSYTKCSKDDFYSST